MRLKGKIAIITGAARGIGREIASKFAEEGASVIMVDIRGAEESAEELQQQGLTARGLDRKSTRLNSSH